MKSIFTIPAATIAMLAIYVAGCGDSTQQEGDASAEAPSIDGSKYLLKAEPEGGLDVIKARESVKDGDDVVVIGRIGGKKDPWLKGRAVFLITDPSLVPCSEIEGDTCKTPWDYCCASDLGTSRATVSIVDDEGRVVKSGAKELLNVKELQTVVVKGKAKRLDGGNLTIQATGIYVKN